MKLISPYVDLNDAWLRGALHAHSTNSDGVDAPHKVWSTYAAIGFDFAALTDHCAQATDAQLETETDLIPISGCEYRTGGYLNSLSPETGLIGVADPLPYDIPWEACGAVFEKQGAFVIYNHPDWDFDHWPVKEMMRLRVGHAIEVYNATGVQLAGSAEVSTKWDNLLACGYRLWGVATDDAHVEAHRGKAWVMVHSARDAKSIVDALKVGKFYASTGVTLESITVENGVIRVSAPNAKAIRFIVERGRIPKQVEGSVGEYTPSASDVYVRIELFGDLFQKAWTNPIFIESPESEKRVVEHLKWFEAV